MHVTAIIAAAGQGRRLGAAVPKQFLQIGGTSIVRRTLDVFCAADCVTDVILVAPADVEHAIVTDGLPADRVRVVAGGATRQESVTRGFDQLRAETEYVIVHDAARPFVTEAIIARTLEAAVATGAAIAAVRVRDTVKHATAGPEPRFTTKTLPRDDIYLAQTPQAFRRDVLGEALALGRTGVAATDEAALVEATGHPVQLVEGDVRNMKITTPDDLVAARTLAGGPQVATMRVGIGYDLHLLTDGRPLVLGGVTIPFERGLAGHSDADALCHAVTDAILGAAALGDIGRHFPDTDAEWKDADSVGLLRRAAVLAAAEGFTLANVDAVIVAERPKLAPFVDEMRRNLAEALGVDAGVIGIKGKTNEGVDATGRGEAIAVHAVAVLTR